MCLTLPKDYTKQIADVDIIVYKHIIKGENGELITPYERFPIELNKLYTSKIVIELDERCEKYIINIGIHSFISKLDTKYLADFYRHLFVECIIPKGSEYYEGIFNYIASIVSNQLIYKKIIN